MTKQKIKTQKENKQPENEKKQVEIGDFKDKYLRTVADFDNFRKRTQSEQEGLRINSKADIIFALFPVINNLNLALKHAPENIDPGWLEGIKHIQKQLQSNLTEEGFSLIDNKEELFNHNRHEAISHEPSKLEENKIIEIVEPGLAYGERVLKPARVRVSNGKLS